MEHTRVPHQDFRRNFRRRREFRERQGKRIHRKYHYGRVPDALLMAGLVVLGFYIAWLVASKGFAFIGDIFSMLGSLI